MKLRTGFVSNSSSSSFVIIAPKDYDWTKTKDLSENDIAILKDTFSPSHRKFNGQDVDVYEGFSNDENDVTYSSKLEEIYGDSEEMWDEANRLWDLFPSLFTDECLQVWKDI